MTISPKKTLSLFSSLFLLLIALPAQAQAGPLTTHQDQFASQLASRTGLQLAVTRAWCLAEESGTAAGNREKAGNNNWLNVGYYDGGDNNWKVSVSSAVTKTIQRMKNFAGGRRILAAGGKSRETQIRAIAGSGWAASGYHNGDDLRNIIRRYHW